MRETDSPNLQNPYHQRRMIDTGMGATMVIAGIGLVFYRPDHSDFLMRTIVIILLTLGGTFMHRQIVKDWAAMVLPFLRDKND